jgi:dTDP-4-amino-4,6-dideoxygalactose transaminase
LFVPLMDLKAQLAAIRREVDEAIRKVLDGVAFIQGEEVREFEEEFAAYCGVTHAVSLGNGTDALGLALRALGVGPGDEVIVPSFTFVATAECVVHAGATPVFADVGLEDFNLDLASVREKLTPRTRAVIPVHLFGHPADMDPLLRLAEERGLAVLEDAAQAHGARYKERRVGSLGHAAAFSFYPSKNLGAFGDGGMVVTRDDRVAERLRYLRNHGSARDDKYRHKVVGYNSRLDTLQAAILRVKLPHLDRWNSARARWAEEYRKRLKGVEGLVLPWPRPWAEPVYHLFVVRVAGRDRVAEALRRAGISASIYYPACLHEQEAFSHAVERGLRLPKASQAAREALALPLFAEMSLAQLEYVAETLIGSVGKLDAS